MKLTPRYRNGTTHQTGYVVEPGLGGMVIIDKLRGGGFYVLAEASFRSHEYGGVSEHEVMRAVRSTLKAIADDMRKALAKIDAALEEESGK